MDLDRDFHVLLSAPWWLLVPLFWAIGLLAICTIQAVMKDIWMRQQTDLIHGDMGALVAEVRRLGDQVAKLQSRSRQAETPTREPNLSVHPNLAAAANNKRNLGVSHEYGS